MLSIFISDAYFGFLHKKAFHFSSIEMIACLLFILCFVSLRRELRFYLVFFYILWWLAQNVNLAFHQVRGNYICPYLPPLTVELSDWNCVLWGLHRLYLTFVSKDDNSIWGYFESLWISQSRPTWYSPVTRSHNLYIRFNNHRSIKGKAAVMSWVTDQI